MAPEEEAESSHATQMVFENGMWNANGALFPRFARVFSEIIVLLSGRRQPHWQKYERD